MSKLCDQVIAVLKGIFPELLIKTEQFVLFKNQKLYLDIFIPQLGLVVEVHGRQHDEFVEYFHTDQDGYKKYRRRDSLKEEWVYQNGHIFLIIREEDFPMSRERMLELIDAAGNLHKS